MKKELYNDIAANIESQPGIEWVDMWKGQENKQKSSYPYNYPAAFISMRAIPWEDMTFNIKEGTATIDVYVFFRQWQDTFEGASDKAESLEIMDVCESIANDLHWLENEFIVSDFTQTGEEDLTDRYGRPTHRLTFSCTVRKEVTPAIHVSK